ncbi:nucleotide exchange factor GrpE [Patescibacteria group bacterium]|nr:nucleotide exchange factor GrpE [Patescibacteria group bacterium]
MSFKKKIKHEGKVENKKAKKSEVNEVEDLKNQLARALADYANLTKRVERERQEFGKMANLIFVTRLLPIFDMLEEAQGQLGDSGLEIIIKEFADLFAEQGVQKIEVGPGSCYNENLHEAVEVVNSPADKKVKENEIVEEVLSGWKYEDGVVIRPAKVKVNK